MPKPRHSDEGKPAFLSRVIGDGESPAWWGIPVARIGACQVRVHLVTPMYLLGVLAHAVWNDLGLPFVLIGLCALALVVIIHEFARGLALVHWGKLHPIDVTLWPLGAVWRFHDEHTARAEGRAALVALFVVTGLCATLAGLLFAFAPDGGRLLLDVFPREGANPALALGGLNLTMGALWQAYALSLYVSLANCLPMLPLDAAMVLRGTSPPGRPTDRVAAIGLVVAPALVVFGMVTGLTPVALLGMCGAVVCWFEWQGSRFRIDPAGVDRWREALRDQDEAVESHDEPGPITPDDRQRVEQVLAKISSQGIDSLTRAERRLLHEATEKLRGG